MRRPDTWQGRDERYRQPCLSSGITPLDNFLCGGWPVATLSELCINHCGIGEVSLLLPLLKQQSKQRQLIWLNPPYQPYAPALKAAGIALQQILIVHSKNWPEWLWSAEQCIRSGALLLGWIPDEWLKRGRSSYADLRKLQLAASESPTTTFLFSDTAANASPAHLRLRLQGNADKLLLTRIKLRGTAAGATLTLPRSAALCRQIPLRQLPALHYPLSDQIKPQPVAGHLINTLPDKPALWLHH